MNTNSFEFHTYEFWNQLTGETLEVEATGFEHASYELFGELDYDYNDWELLTVDGKY